YFDIYCTHHYIERLKISKALFFLLYETFPVCVKKSGKFFDTFFQRFSVVRVPHKTSLGGVPHRNLVGGDIYLLRHCRLFRSKRLMSRQKETVRVVDQCISRDSRYFLICLAETAVDHDHLAAALHRALAFPLMNGDVSVDDMALRGIQTELTQHGIHHVLPLQKTEISALFLLVRFLIRDKISLKGRHFILAEKRGIGSRPDIPQDISAFSLFLTVHGVKRSADISFQHIVQFPAFTGSAVNLYFFQASVLIEGDTAVEKKIPVIDLIQSAFIQKKADMFLQSLAVAESRFQTIHNILLAGAQLVGMLPVYRWETCIQKRIFLPVRKGDGSFIRIDPVEKAAVLHMEFLPSAEKFSLQFELDHGDRL